MYWLLLRICSQSDIVLKVSDEGIKPTSFNVVLVLLCLTSNKFKHINPLTPGLH